MLQGYHRNGILNNMKYIQYAYCVIFDCDLATYKNTCTCMTKRHFDFAQDDNLRCATFYCPGRLAPVVKLLFLSYVAWHLLMAEFNYVLNQTREVTHARKYLRRL